MAGRRDQALSTRSSRRRRERSAGRLRYPHGNYKPFHDLLDASPEVLEAHHVTGDDCFVIKVAARSMKHLEEVSGRIASLGSVTTSVVYSSPLPRRPLSR